MELQPEPLGLDARVPDDMQGKVQVIPWQQDVRILWIRHCVCKELQIRSHVFLKTNFKGINRNCKKLKETKRTF